MIICLVADRRPDRLIPAIGGICQNIIAVKISGIRIRVRVKAQRYGRFRCCWFRRLFWQIPAAFLLLRHLTVLCGILRSSIGLRGTATAGS